MPILERILAYLLLFIGLPGVVFFFVRAILRDKTEVERLKAKRDLAEAEARADEAKAKALAEENRKYDRLIEASEKGEGGGPSAAHDGQP